MLDPVTPFMPERVVHCRRRLSRDCYNGLPASEIYFDGNPAEDGTYDMQTDTVVCDACYI